MGRYKEARSCYADFGVDTEAALAKAASVPLSINCWQGDDVCGFDRAGGGAGNGIQTTGNYPGKARNFAELTEDFLFAAHLIPGKKRVNLHACYAVFTEKQPRVDRDQIRYEHFAPWVEFAKENGFGLDFNPTCFSHPCVKDGLTLSSPDEKTRRFWIEHCKASRRIAGEIGAALNDSVLNNVWIPDGYKDIPSDRLGPRLRLRDSLDEIFAEKIPRVIDSVESKVFAIGVESYTVGSHEFYLNYAASHPGVYPLLDNGHFHPTETVSDKISALLPFFDKIPLHLTRAVRWDSDHVPLFDDELREIMRELARAAALDKAILGLDFFDASINRIAAWIMGGRSAQKALLFALLEPVKHLRETQDSGDFTSRLALLETEKTMPFCDVWEEYCGREIAVWDDRQWLSRIKAYEKDVLSKRA